MKHPKHPTLSDPHFVRLKEYPFGYFSGMPFGMSKFQQLQLKLRLSKGIYWIQPSRRILWNYVLVTDYLLNGDTPQHQALVEDYVSRLPEQMVPSGKTA